MLSEIKKNSYHQYYKADVEDIGLPLFNRNEKYDYKKYYSKTRLYKESKIRLTAEQENNPHAFSRGSNGYYPLWDINKIK